MARKCASCGSADTSVGLHEVTCLSCGAETKIEAPSGDGTRIPNPDGAATYALDPSDTPPEKPKAKAKAKAG